MQKAEGRRQKAEKPRRSTLLISAFCLLPSAFCLPSASAQQQQQDPTHDISKVDVVQPGSAIATPLPEAQRRKLKKYDIPELVGAKQALGPQLIDGKLRRPLVDFMIEDAGVIQRLSIFEQGLVTLKMTGAGGDIRKKLLVPQDALESYLRTSNAAALAAIGTNSLTSPETARRGVLRVYEENGKYVEREFHPAAVLPKSFSDQVLPLQDLLRAMSEDRTVTSTVANYEPRVGDELVGDNQKVYRVVRVVEPHGVVELECLDDPTRLYVGKKDLHHHFVGAAPKRAEREE